jgi:hypothetical protein
MLERRLLVTATSQNSNTESNTDVGEENSPESGPIAKTELPDVEHVEDVDDVNEVDDEYPFERKASEPELREISLPVCATPELEHSTVDSPMAAVTMELVPDKCLDLEPVVVAKDAQTSQKTAQIGLLELPTGLSPMNLVHVALLISCRGS